MTEASERLARYEQAIADAVSGWRWRPVAEALQALPGIALLAAATLVAEIGPIERFAQQLLFRLIEQVMPYSLSLAWKAWLAYWLPRSE